MKNLKNTLNVKKFILAKVREQELRHQKFSKSGYLLEPNIKESRDVYVTSISFDGYVQQSMEIITSKLC